MTVALTPSQTLAAPLTTEDYLAAEVQSEIRNEYRNGEVIAMTSGTPAHNQLISAFNALLWFALRGKPYSVFVTDCSSLKYWRRYND
jgi:Uma2 family endonuclease